MADKLQPIIIKRVKKGGHGAHGGAWKIAYADFVTAMMAFFLLMWLLGSTAKGDLQGIAEYFASPMKVAMQGGDGAGNSSSVIQGGGTDLARVYGQMKRSESDASKGHSSQQQKQTQSIEAQRAERARVDAQRIKELQGKLESVITQDMALKEYRSQIRIDVTPDGLQVQIVDDQNRPMFDSGSALVKNYMRSILRAIGGALGGVENHVSIAGHTDSTPYGNGDRGYSNWELSADRANASRRELVAGGMPDSKLVRVVGLASSDPLEPQDPRAASNRRITITVLTKEAEERLMSRDLPTITVPAEPEDKKPDNLVKAAPG
ncbi:MAG: flagellar motor protein MotB [Comamonas sp. SCN 65-56]|uniref:flagellar motor protein MotB n=1 Tax=Comamonas sp. SCN 65-56 TaxID=1660095 RepID=UPI00086CD393|nr:flagellar motor protein MotB [Comamonas sp. SCN 65-56]ODS90629.1 MAG: flagellar motor protein MotB [Comamonas sp. SCN 65-56]